MFITSGIQMNNLFKFLALYVGHNVGLNNAYLYSKLLL